MTDDIRPRDLRESGVLIVSEDPDFIEETRAVLQSKTAPVISCLGPAQSECELDVGGWCPLASHVGMVIVDAPQNGVFRWHQWELPAGSYASRLARIHPSAFVLLVGAEVGRSGPAGGVAHAADRSEALSIIQFALDGELEASV